MKKLMWAAKGKERSMWFCVHSKHSRLNLQQDIAFFNITLTSLGVSCHRASQNLNIFLSEAMYHICMRKLDSMWLHGTSIKLKQNQTMLEWWSSNLGKIWNKILSMTNWLSSQETLQKKGLIPVLRQCFVFFVFFFFLVSEVSWDENFNDMKTFCDKLTSKQIHQDITVTYCFNYWKEKS